MQKNANIVIVLNPVNVDKKQQKIVTNIWYHLSWKIWRQGNSNFFDDKQLPLDPKSS